LSQPGNGLAPSLPLQEQNTLEMQDPENTQDFDKAYLKLIGKYSKEQGGELLIPNSDLYRYNTTEKFDPVKKQREIQESEMKRQTKIDQMKLEQEQKEVADCTFEPVMHTSKMHLNSTA